jgi:hypothetical protein
MLSQSLFFIEQVIRQQEKHDKRDETRFSTCVQGSGFRTVQDQAGRDLAFL